MVNTKCVLDQQRTVVHWTVSKGRAGPKRRKHGGDNAESLKHRQTSI